jgi:hypothetical protein
MAPRRGYSSVATAPGCLWHRGGQLDSREAPIEVRSPTGRRLPRLSPAAPEPVDRIPRRGEKRDRGDDLDRPGREEAGHGITILLAGEPTEEGAGRSPRPFPRPALEPRTPGPARLDGRSGTFSISMGAV